MRVLVTESLLVRVALGIAALTAVVGIVTLITAGWYHRRHRTEMALRDRLKNELLERLFEPDPGWRQWVETLSNPERRQLRQLLDGYLRQLRGTEHDKLRGLAVELGIPEEARRNLASGRKRFRALTWLALLNEPVGLDRLEQYCTDRPRDRAGAARVLYESFAPDAAQEGTELLLGDRTHPLSAFGLDTLYRLNNGSETPLLTVANEFDAWDERLVVQVLTVLRYCSIPSDDRLGFLPELLTHESARIRAATVGVIERHGWHESFRARIDIGRLLADPDATVRSDSYLLLASLGDAWSAAWLQRTMTDESADLLALVRALSAHPRIELPEGNPRFDPFVDWVRAEDRVSRRRRIWGVKAAWA